jgi:deoxyribodipyrimidine photo-lyase
MQTLVWFREDLRTKDNPALYHAAKNSTAGVVAVFLLDTAMWQEHTMAACRVDFLLRGLQALSVALQELNIALLIETVTGMKAVPAKILALVKSTKSQAVFFNRQYEVNEARRDAAVVAILEKNQLDCHTYNDQMILAPNSVLNKQGEYFKVFTPYKRAWLNEFKHQKIKLLPAPKKQPRLAMKASPVPTLLKGFDSNVDPALWTAGEKAAQKQLGQFTKLRISAYEKTRDFPAVAGTSNISPYLSAGMISARECFLTALASNHDSLDAGNLGARTWMSELIWREFYKQIMISVPRICMGRAYKLATEKLPWNSDKKQLIAWQTGNTGFPLIDAAMRQLNQTGWMHNRLRMVTAMFLAKNLFLDWRLGEKYFITHLIDGDLASNNGGWQWCASTGTDAVPYFRVFNPVTQSQRFDPAGDFIRQYCPELKDFDKKAIHDPYRYNAKLAASVNYPRPLVDLTTTRKQAIALFKKLGAKAAAGAG